jgi:nucleotide-binding universal stress UspA family protein
MTDPAALRQEAHIGRIHSIWWEGFAPSDGGDGHERRRQALADLQALALAAGTPVFDPSPEELIREVRAR